MTRWGVLAATSLLIAPFQCESTRDPNLRREDTAGDALWGLSEKFRQTGEAQARNETLRYLLEKYPSSRYAAYARDELQARDASSPGR
jgi:outer membrane protein assembly factor BamD (BamD/ComL family)